LGRLLDSVGCVLRIDGLLDIGKFIARVSVPADSYCAKIRSGSLANLLEVRLWPSFGVAALCSRDVLIERDAFPHQCTQISVPRHLE